MEQRKLIVYFNGGNEELKEVAIKEVLTYLEDYDKGLAQRKIPVIITIDDITNII